MEHMLAGVSAMAAGIDFYRRTFLLLDGVEWRFMLGLGVLEGGGWRCWVKGWLGWRSAWTSLRLIGGLPAGIHRVVHGQNMPN